MKYSKKEMAEMKKGAGIMDKKKMKAMPSKMKNCPTCGKPM